METSATFGIATWAVFGLVVGSFLNVAIYRLPLESESVSHPKRSRCPSCRHGLTWKENLPVLSWVLLRGRCRWCRWPIPWRYPLVELLTAFLWGLAAYLAPEGAEGPPWLTLIHVVVLSGLVVATFVDFDHFEIPDEVSIGGIVLAPLASILVPRLHEHSWIAGKLAEGGEVTAAGALFSSLAGILVGGGILIAIGWLGRIVFKRDAMGFGDVKLLAAGGGFVGPGGALAALFIGTFAASIAGVLNMARFFWLSWSRRQVRGGPRSWQRSLRIARIAGRYLPFGPYLGIGIGIALLGWNHVGELFRAYLFSPY